MYQVATGAGFHDVWFERHPDDAGLTCCHRTNLINEQATFIERIDFVFARGLGPLNPRQTDLTFRVGFRPNERVPGPVHPLWASDHAGLVATWCRRPTVELPSPTAVRPVTESPTR
jgi:hypothetical protein